MSRRRPSPPGPKKWPAAVAWLTSPTTATLEIHSLLRQIEGDDLDEVRCQVINACRSELALDLGRPVRLRTIELDGSQLLLVIHPTGEVTELQDDSHELAPATPPAAHNPAAAPQTPPDNEPAVEAIHATGGWDEPTDEPTPAAVGDNDVWAGLDQPATPHSALRRPDDLGDGATVADANDVRPNGTTTTVRTTGVAVRHFTTPPVTAGARHAIHPERVASNRRGRRRALAAVVFLIAAIAAGAFAYSVRGGSDESNSIAAVIEGTKHDAAAHNLKRVTAQRRARDRARLIAVRNAQRERRHRARLAALRRRQAQDAARRNAAQIAHSPLNQPAPTSPPSTSRPTPGKRSGTASSSGSAAAEFGP